ASDGCRDHTDTQLPVGFSFLWVTPNSAPRLLNPPLLPWPSPPISRAAASLTGGRHLEPPLTGLFIPACLGAGGLGSPPPAAGAPPSIKSTAAARGGGLRLHRSRVSFRLV
ncbi:unnamed protein product, partial [Urochloa humidicola]